MRIRLTRKLANSINGVDVSKHRVGDVLDLPLREARMLLAEGWAVAVEPNRAAAAEAQPARRDRDR